MCGELRLEQGPSVISLKYDPVADAAYISVAQNVADGEAVRQLEIADSELSAQVILDLDEGGYLLGVEVLGAKKLLRPDTLKKASRY